jgi:hypothetical protein
MPAVHGDNLPEKVRRRSGVQAGLQGYLYNIGVIILLLTLLAAPTSVENLVL